jgi:GT2 family glycosyltransferase
LIEEDNKWPSVSVVVLNYNGVKFIERCLKFILDTDYPNFEVILADNASTDGSVEIARSFSMDPCLKIVANPSNMGFAEGNNIGAIHAKGEIIAFLNVDTEVDPNWLKELVELMESDPRIGAAQCKLLMDRDRGKLESAGHYVNYMGIESFESASVKGQLDDGRYDQVKEIFYAKGAAIAVRKNVFFNAGMFDPAYFMDHDEIDLCWRIRLMGYRIVFAPSSRVYHRGGGLVGEREENPFILFHLRKNHIMSLIKNYELKNTMKYLPTYLTFLLIHGLYSGWRGRTHVLPIYLRAMGWVLTKLQYVYAQRLKVQRRVRRIRDSEVMRYMTKLRIPWHFLNR